MGPQLEILTSRQGPQVVPWHRLVDQWYFGGDQLMSVWSFFAAAMIVASIVGLLWLWRWGSARRHQLTPMRIFHQVLAGLGLTQSDKGLVVRIARQQSLITPLTLVLSEGTFEHHLNQYAQSVRPRRRAKDLAHAARIQQILFGVANR